MMSITWIKYIIPPLFVLSLMTSCKKEEELEIRITNLKSITDLYERDTLKIQYQAIGKNLDSVSLLIDGNIRKTLKTTQNTIWFITESHGAYSIQLKLKGWYKSGKTALSGTFYVNVSNLITPPLDFIITKDDGSSIYFVGEKLSITIKARFESQNLNDYQQVTLYLNDVCIGTRTSAPMTFISDVITSEQNQLKVVLKDSNNRLHYVTFDLSVSSDSPPVISYEFAYRHNIPPGYFFTSDFIVSVLYGTDNVKISYVDYYLDDKLFKKKQMDIDRVFYDSVAIGKLSPGAHNIYCIAFDDRGQSTKSRVLPIHVYTDIDLDQEVRDVEYSDDEESIFVLTPSRLYVLNPVLEEVTRTIVLPFSDATSMDFSAATERLFIASKQGRLIYWSTTTLDLTDVTLIGISNIQDMEIDNENNMALICNNKLLVINLISGKLIKTYTQLDPEATLIFDKTNKFIYTGGNPHASRSYFYKYQLGTDTLTYRKRADILAYVERLEYNPDGTEFLISPYPITYKTLDLSLNKTYQQAYTTVSTYSYDGNFIYMGDDNSLNLDVFDAKTMTKVKTFPIPMDVEYTINYLLPDKNNTRLAAMTIDAFTTKVKIIFARLN